MKTLVQFIRRDNQRHTRWLHAHPIKACLIAVAIGYLSATISWMMVYEADRVWPVVALFAATYAIWPICYYRDCKKMGWTIGIVAGLWAMAAQGQIVVTPTAYTHTIEGQNRIGTKLFRSSWVTEYTHTHVLSVNSLVVIHTVYYESSQAFWQIPKKREFRFSYRGFRTFFMTNMQIIKWDAPKADGSGWVVTTNSFDTDPSLNLYKWMPTMSGRSVTGNEYWRTIETGSPLSCIANNLAGTPRMLTVPCWHDSVGFPYRIRLTPGMRLISIGLDTVGEDVGYFTFDLDRMLDDPTL